MPIIIDSHGPLRTKAVDIGKLLYRNDLRLCVFRAPRLVVRIEQHLASESEEGEGEEEPEQWREFVLDLWEARLPHLREEGYGYGDGGGFMFNPATGRYGFQEGSDYESEGELMEELMQEDDHAPSEGEGSLVEEQELPESSSEEEESGEEEKEEDKGEGDDEGELWGYFGS